MAHHLDPIAWLRARQAFALIGFLCGDVLLAQCTTTISTFPYTEGFETAPAWTSGGTNNDWAWGAPNHPSINSAAEGNNAWCVGGLTGSFYSNNQQSWLELPCFDLSLLDYPWLSFWIYWETEPGYDGVGLQYSPNEGVTWVNVGTVNEEDCLTQNWFNSPTITALNLASPKRGWSGTTTTGNCANGGGSGTWVKASHCLDGLPTGTPLKFRFIFGAGSICNTFDGAAIDDVYIGEAPTLTPNITFTCSGNTVTFTNTASLCVENSTWNFGDPGSGANNTATQPVASHTYPGPGTYVVSLTMTGPCTAPVTTTTEVIIGDLEITTTEVGCAGNNGTATAEVTGSAGPFSYAWSPGNEISQTITGLGAGTYTVLVQAADMCPVQGSVELLASSASISLVVDLTNVSCNGLSDGTASVAASGGSGTYTYAWSPTGGSSASATGLVAGNYTCTVQDDAGCTAEAQATIAEPDAIGISVSAATTICDGETVTLTALANGGIAPFSYTWSPSGPEVAPTVTTIFTVLATDANGCTSATVDIPVTVVDAAEPSFTWDIDQGCTPLCVTFADATLAPGERQWSFGDGGVAGDVTAPTHCFENAGVFDVTLVITTANGCSGSFTANDAIEAIVTPLAEIAASPAVALIDNPTFQFMDRSVGATSWSWTFGDALNSVAEGSMTDHTYSDVGCFTVGLEVANDAGCFSSATTLVCVEDEFTVHAPNCVTPNNDGINDQFAVVTTVADPDFFELEIFDRWGIMIHRSTDPLIGWDPQDVPQGIYAWRLSIRDTQQQMQKRSGHISLLR